MPYRGSRADAARWVRDALRTQIVEGALSQLGGSPVTLPPEALLAIEYGVSRNAIRQALDLLRGEGMVTRKRGVGTVVTGPKLRQRFDRLEGLAESLGGQQFPVDNHVLSVGEVQSSQPLITPSSPHESHRHSMRAGRSGRKTTMRPGQGLRPGRRRHGRALTQAVPASPAVAARTMFPSCSAILRAGPGASSGMSRKWRRSETNMLEHCSERPLPPGGSRSVAYRPYTTPANGVDHHRTRVVVR